MFMNKTSVWNAGWLIFCGVQAGLEVEAKVQPAAIFTDNAVLQQNLSLPVWGTAADGQVVTVKINGQEASSPVVKGKWMVRLKPMSGGGPFTMTIAGENTVQLTNILMGEVWLCSGQSNMQWPLAETEKAEEFIAASVDRDLRLFTVPLVTASSPAADLPGGRWDICNPGTVRGFSAVAYHFGRELRKVLRIPIGLINDSYGGSIVEAWTSEPYIRSDPESSQHLFNKPEWAEGPQNGFCLLYNGMIAPIVPYGIRGVIWYQGEGNTVSGEAVHYRKSFPLLVRNWREDWGLGDFPFLFVQLAPWEKDEFFHVAVDPEGTGWAVVREAQLNTSRTVTNTAMVVITDAGDKESIHPRRKEPVGQRLALAARAVAYGQKVDYRGPSYRAMRVRGAKVVLSFYDADKGLVVQGDTATGFAVAGVDQRFYPAQAKVVRQNQIEVWSDQVPEPVAVRYGWANCPVVNMASRAGMPMSPFRTDNWPPEKPFVTYKLPPSSLPGTSP
jgi:sialate O-acetylesterase